MPGRSPLSGEHRGVDDILDFFARTMELTGGTFRVELHDVVANDEHAVALYVARGEREGKTQETRACSVSHVCDSKFLETWQHSEDQYAADEFLSKSS
jgi:uncharacterized protein